MEEADESLSGCGNETPTIHKGVIFMAERSSKIVALLGFYDGDLSSGEGWRGGGATPAPERWRRSGVVARAKRQRRCGTVQRSKMEEKGDDNVKPTVDSHST
ncbi:hypothetical protein GUJ93_ZPchr0006g41825 [Zizania palustris]|uniref:Uncharacterized protein n=1 Tax=Zizania palustris TaxID=103762 RepID=A0A8J5SYM8_ZIZPA|nr:hypothetical protein GUJ93_ZPchr0006g41825 [Zizania palustris]